MSAVDVAALAAELAPLLAVEMGARDPVYTPRTLAERLGISERTARELIAGPHPKIPSFKVEGGRKIDPAEVEAYIARCKAEEARAA